MWFFFCCNLNGTLDLLCEAFHGCWRDCRRSGFSVCWRTVVCRHRQSGVRSFWYQVLVWAGHFSFTPFPRTRSSSESRHPGRPPPPLFLCIFQRLANIVFILCGSEVVLSPGCSLGALSLYKSLFIWLLIGKRFGSSGLRLFAWFHRTFGLIHPSCPAALVTGGFNATQRGTRKQATLSLGIRKRKL